MSARENIRGGESFAVEIARRTIVASRDSREIKVAKFEWPRGRGKNGTPFLRRGRVVSAASGGITNI